jgi:hypothetical protein
MANARLAIVIGQHGILTAELLAGRNVGHFAVMICIKGGQLARAMACRHVSGGRYERRQCGA